MKFENLESVKAYKKAISGGGTRKTISLSVPIEEHEKIVKLSKKLKTTVSDIYVRGGAGFVHATVLADTVAGTEKEDEIRLSLFFGEAS